MTHAAVGEAPEHSTDAFTTEVVHVVGLPHWPFAPHVSSCVPEHCVAPGVHTPAQLVPRQMYWQAEGVPHVPAEQASTLLPTHWVVPLVHEPAHVPAVHTYWHAVPVFCQVPVLSQTCGC